jgi:hypothetical protein
MKDAKTHNKQYIILNGKKKYFGPDEFPVAGQKGYYAKRKAIFGINRLSNEPEDETE